MSSWSAMKNWPGLKESTKPTDPFERAMRELEKRGETMEPTPEDYALDAMAVANMREIER